MARSQIVPSLLCVSAVLFCSGWPVNRSSAQATSTTAETLLEQAAQEAGISFQSDLPDGVRAVIEGVDPILVMSFYHDDHSKYAYQCGNQGTHYARVGDFLDEVRINTDWGWGGCRIAFGIIDPRNSLGNPDIRVSFVGDPVGNPECEYANTYQIPVTNTKDKMTPTFRINTDYRTGHCNLTFDVRHPSLQMDVVYYADDAGVDQCINRIQKGSWHTAKQGSTVTLGLNTDERHGGCRFSLRLRR